MKKKMSIILFAVYIILSVLITKFLLDRNENGAFETKDSYYVCNSAIEEYNKTALVKFDKQGDYTNLINEKVYYYDEELRLKSGELKSLDNEKQTFDIDDETLEMDKMLGKPVKAYIAVGLLINFFTEKVIYLLFVILPVGCLLVYEIYLLFSYLNNNKGKTNHEEKKTK